jgi:hypothetical protein
MIKRLMMVTLVTCLAGSYAASQADTGKSLADLYRTGKIRFVPILTIDEKSLPKDVFLESPWSMAKDAKGNLFVGDYRAKNVKMFDASGKYVKTIGRGGQGPGEFGGPSSILVVQDRLIVSDVANRRYSQFTLDGQFVKSVPMTREGGFPLKMRARADGAILMAWEKWSYGQADKPQDCILGLFSSDMEPRQTLYSHAVMKNKLMQVEKMTMNIIQPFAPDVHWDVLPDGRLVVGFSEKYQFEIIGTGGEKLSSFSRPVDPVKITEEDKKIFFDGMTSSSGDGNISRGAPDFIVKNTVFPKTKAAFDDLLTDSEGNILVFHAGSSKEEAWRTFDAFDSKGTFLATVRIEGDIPLSSGTLIRDRAFWSVKGSEDGASSIVKYEMTGAR